MNINIWPCSSLYRFSSLCLVVIFSLGCTTLKSDRRVFFYDEKADSGVTLEPEQSINIYTKDKRIVRMNGTRFYAKNIDGKLLVIEEGEVNGKFSVFEKEEVRKITLDGQYNVKDPVNWTHEEALPCFMTMGFVCPPTTPTEQIERVTRNDKKSDDDYRIAFKWYQQAANQGDPIAMANIGSMYAEGRGVPENKKTAIDWYELAAAQGVDEARLYALHIKAKANAEQGDAQAQNNLGSMYRHGKGVSQDYKAAFKWYTLAADQGHAQAQNNLGEMYETGWNVTPGWGITRDYEVAVKWYRLAAGQGNAQAQNNLGWMYEAGLGVTQDLKAAFKWYKAAADQGHAQAQDNLGWMYESGRGVNQDYKAAFKWYKAAADQGHAYARSRLDAIKDHRVGFYY